jgi:hypothetical protein
MSDFTTHDEQGILLSPTEFMEANNLSEIDSRAYLELLVRDHQSLTAFARHIAVVLNTITKSLNAAIGERAEAADEVDDDVVDYTLTEAK